ncbi:hypothetical protein BBK82_01740 [Lentzea guizhouensis]|uniref:DUF4239 domain-containing protein n=1 Tax=Lentzea guizhouensis TaxID=1586287 RepID=A0A1B2HB87_9PSEU|nr:DUF4239 domain-containing protein [Lentzea guizhouensis]ANZ34984.1 hypothetical protein BBK82_01740 [Lentzea guizhouensis]
MSIYVSGLLWVLGAAAVSSVIVVITRRFGSDEVSEKNLGAGGSVFSIVAGLHAVLVAFILISLFDAANGAEEQVQKEANALVAVNWSADSLPEPAKSRVDQLIRDYVQTVVDDEWPKMREGEDVDNKGWNTLNQLRDTIATASPNGDWQEDRKAEAANQLWEVYQARQERIDASGGGVNPVVWLALLIGTGLSLLFPYLFGGPNLVSQLLITVTLSSTLVLLLFAIYQLQNPFSGGVHIPPDAFSSALDRLS